MFFWRWILTFLFCVTVVAVLGFVKFNQIQAAIAFGESFPESSETVLVEVVQNSQWQANLQVTAEVLATRSLAVRNELEGIITSVGFRSGGAVAKGQVLLQLDVANEQAQLDAIVAQVSIAQLDVNRFSKLLESNASSRDQYDRAKAQLAIEQARVRALESIIAKKTLIAHFDSVAGLHELEAGAYLSANTLITQLVSAKNEMWVDFSVPQEYANLYSGDRVIISSASLFSGTLDANIIGVSQVIAQDSRSLRARALWTNVPKRVKPGALVEVSLVVGEVLDVVRLPSVAVLYDAFGSFVFSLNQDDQGDWRASRQPVVVQGRVQKNTILSSGVKAGDTVATIGASKLREGILTNIVATDPGLETGSFDDE
jgi:membrane fusion protein (multidrug efflux system)